MSRLLASPIPWLGGKNARSPTGTGRWIASTIPYNKDHHYVEPFGGMFGVGLQRPPCMIETLNDMSSNLINWWLYVQRDVDAIAQAIDFPLSRQIVDCAEIWLNENPIKELDVRNPSYDHALWWSVLKLSCLPFQRSYQLKFYSNPSPRPDKDVNKLLLKECYRRIRNVQIEHTDAVDLIDRMKDVEMCLLYLDPPYTEQIDYYENTYNRKDMVKILPDVKGIVCISGYENDWPELIEAGWHTVKRKAFSAIGVNTRKGKTKEGATTVRIECIYSNRPLVTQEKLF